MAKPRTLSEMAAKIFFINYTLDYLAIDVRLTAEADIGARSHVRLVPIADMTIPTNQ
jgi:hypothetical protein